MSYLIYHSITHPTTSYIRRLKEIPIEQNLENDESLLNAPSFSLEENQMKSICSQVKEYLESTKAYLRSDLSLATLSQETGIPQKNLSRSINSHLNCNFFELRNRMRMEEAKRQLLDLETSGYKIDSIYEGCGFRTRSTFFLAFKKAEGISPAQWLKSAAKT